MGVSDSAVFCLNLMSGKYNRRRTVNGKWIRRIIFFTAAGHTVKFEIIKSSLRAKLAFLIEQKRCPPEMQWTEDVNKYWTKNIF